MTTREAIAAMTDAARFERLATAALRKIDPDCAALIHQGVNAKGKPVKGAIDAWCLVPGSNPPRFVFVAISTTTEKKLKQKWLAGAKKSEGANLPEPGDLLKASSAAAIIRNEHAGAASFRMVFATNQLVNEALQREVYACAREHRLDPHIIEQSQLADFLDFDSYGQYLRKSFFGFDVQLISTDLLRDIGEISCLRHAQEFLVDKTRPPVNRRDEINLKNVIGEHDKTLIYIVAESGFGKTTSANRLLSDHLRSGSCGLWIPAQTISSSTSLSGAVSKVLLDIIPTLAPDAAQSLASCLPAETRLLLLVDDINREPNPRALLRKLQAWSAPTEDSSNQVASASHVIICPVWPQIWSADTEPRKHLAWVGVAPLGRFARDEAVAVITGATSDIGVQLTRSEHVICAARLNDDPYLIGLFVNAIRHEGHQANFRGTADAVFEQFVTSTLADISARPPNAHLLVTDFRRCLHALGRLIIEHRELRPKWPDVREWLSERLPSVAEAAEILRIDGTLYRTSVDEELVFRHDRFQNDLLIEAMSELLHDAEVTSEPAFAQIIGAALLKTPERDLPQVLDRLVLTNPLALFESIRCCDGNDTVKLELILDVVRTWIRDKLAQGRAPSSVVDAIGECLMEMDNHLVEEFAESSKWLGSFQLAALRNGCAWGGACYCARLSNADFAPAIRSDPFDRSFKIGTDRHLHKLVDGVRTLLTDCNLDVLMREGTLVMAGYLGSETYKEEIIRCWNESTDKARILPEVIWATMFCAGKDMPRLLDPVLDFWAGLPDESDEHGRSPRLAVAQSLARGLVRQCPEAAVDYLIEKARTIRSLEGPLQSIIHSIDSPNAIESLVRVYASRARAQGQTKVSDFALTWASRRWDPSQRSGASLSNASRLRLKHIWEEQGNDTTVRSVAFKMWAWGVSAEDLPSLTVITKDSCLYEASVFERALIGDHSVTPEFLAVLSRNIWYASAAHRIWNSRVFLVFDDLIGMFAGGWPQDSTDHPSYAEHCLVEALRHIPPRDVETLLSKHWQGLRSHVDFVHCALFTGTPTCLTLAAQSITKAAISEPFQHIGMRASAQASAAPTWNRRIFLENIERYLDRIPANELRWLTQNCEIWGLQDWARMHLVYRLAEQDRKRFVASDAEIVEGLAELLTADDLEARVYYFLENLKRIAIPEEHTIDLISTWLNSERSAPRYIVAAEFISQIGRRKDLELLHPMPAGGQTEKTEAAAKSAEFAVKRRWLK